MKPAPPVTSALMLALPCAPPDRKPSVASREHSRRLACRARRATAQSGLTARHRTRNNGEMSEDRLFDVAVVGGGIVGLATAFQLLRSQPALSVAVIEKEAELGVHQTGHNSGVLHAGLYYTPGSLKARLCREGKVELERFADEHGIPYRHCGKLVVALDETEIPRLMALKERAVANGVEGLEEVGPERIRELEPHVSGIRGLWSPRTGIIDFRRVALAYADEVRARGGTVVTGVRVVAVRDTPSERVVISSAGRFRARGVIACAGLHADRLARRSGVLDGPRMVPFRGDYYTLVPEARHLVNGLVYPVPDPRFPFLGVHFTRRTNDEVWAGPNAVVAFAREGYRRRDVVARDLAETARLPGLLAARTAVPSDGPGRDVARRLETGVRRGASALRPGAPGRPAGVRAVRRAGAGDLPGRVDGRRLRDWRYGNVLHVINAPSPAATASLAIGRVLAETTRRFSAA